MRLIDADALDKMLMDAQAVSKEKGGNFRCGVIGSVRENIRMMPTIKHEVWDYHYEAACRIVQAFDSEYPSPNVLEVIQALSFAAVKQNTISTEEIVQWAKDYCAEWYDKHMKDGEQE